MPDARRPHLIFWHIGNIWSALLGLPVVALKALEFADPAFI
jgi:hypothetical protein